MAIVVIQKLVFNGEKQLKKGDKQKWPISFYWKAHTVSVWLKCEKPGFSLQADVSIQQAQIKCKLKG